MQFIRTISSVNSCFFSFFFHFEFKGLTLEFEVPPLLLHVLAFLMLCLCHLVVKVRDLHELKSVGVT